MPLITATRYHDFSAGHRVVGHENKCASLHGHNYRVHFECAARELDTVGRVIDFGDIKTRLCDWLEDRWDHCFLLWEDDPLSRALQSAPCPAGTAMEDFDQWLDSFHTVPFNPTAENMARHLLTIVAPGQLKGTGIVCCSVLVEETRKCSASAVLTQREMDILLGVGK